MSGKMRSALAIGLVGLLTGIACAKKDYTRLYRTEPKPEAWSEQEIGDLKYLGPTLVDRGVNFGVYSGNAARVDLLLFDDPESARPTKRFEMVKFGDVWNLYVEGVGVGQHYGYVAWGPNWTFDPEWYPGSIAGFVADVDPAGNRFNPNKLLTDPYGKAIHRDHDWSKGSLASGPKRTESTWAAASKSVVVTSDYEWSATEATWRNNRQQSDFPGHNGNDLILYEVHVKGFTNETASGVAHPGTFRGVGEKADYLQGLGITAVELLPVHEKPQDGGYWGYWNLSYFAPENTYAATDDPREYLDEFKWMVDELHKRGIEVILDVVYNHTGEGGLWRERQYTDDVNLDPESSINLEAKEVAGIYSYRGLDNQAYYALSGDNQTFWNNTGVGQQLRPNVRPSRKLIIDSLRFHVEEMHVDGFRFDLAGILGERDGDYNTWDNPANTVLQDIIDDPILQKYNTRIIAEPWTTQLSYGPLIGAYPNSASKPGTGWGEWNARFRDWWRAFANDDAWKLNSQEGTADGGSTLTGSSAFYAWNGRRPYHSVNLVTVHDGFTMYDVFTYPQRQNNCGPLNPVCCTAPTSSWCETDGGEQNNRSRDWGSTAAGEAFKRQQMRNMFSVLMIAHGTPMILGGDEWMRTQFGNNNAYSSGADNEYNWFRWGEWIANDDKNRMHDFVSKIIAVRKSHAYAFAPAQYGASAPFSWRNATNTGDPNWGGRHLAIHYYDPAAGPELFILINFERTPVDFTVPAGRTWGRIVDTQSTYDDPLYLAANQLDPRATANIESGTPDPIPGAIYAAQGTSIVILEALP